jgi:NADH:ubiquinone oxidoreductase subunit 3 (subunit A)
VLGERRSLVLVGLTLIGCAVVLGRYVSVVSFEPLALLFVALAFAVVFGLACLGLGAPVAAWAVGPREATLAWLALAVSAGAGLLAAVAFVLGCVGAFIPALLDLMLVGAAVAGAAQAARLRALPRAAAPRPPATAALLLACAAAVTLVAASVPSAFYDQVNYHLAFPYHWLRLHRMVVFPRHDYSYLPSNMGLLYGYALAALPVWAGQVVHWCMGVVSVVATAALAHRLAGAKAAAWGAAIFAVAPATLLCATWAGNDLGVAAFAAASWLMVAVGCGETSARTWRWWLLAGALAGLAVGCKLVALATIVVPLIVVLLVPWRPAPDQPQRARAVVGRMLIFLAGAGAAFLPWAVRSFVLTGNPIYPLLSGATVGGAKAVGHAFLGGAERFPGIVAWTWEKLTALPRATLVPRGAAGNIGPIFLAMLPAVVVGALIRRRALERLCVLGLVLGIAGWSLGPQLGRYLLPVLLLAAALAGAVWSEVLAAWNKAVSVALQTVLAVALAWSALGGVSSEVVARIGCALGTSTSEEWLERAIDYWPAARFVNDRLPAQAKLLLVAEARSLYFDRDVVVEDPFRKPLLVELAEREGTHPAIAGRLAAMGVTHVLFNQAEALRIAEMNRRSDYFECNSPAARARIQAFFQEELRPLFTHGRVAVFALRTPAP